jgi:cell division protein ZapA (FtsZ GTPase activity inhibitor)
VGEARHSIEVSLLGSSFTIQSQYDPRYMSEVIDYLQGKIKEVQAASCTRDSLKIALLASLNVVDELFRLRSHPREEEEESDSRQIKEITERLIDKIDKSLVEN